MKGADIRTAVIRKLAARQRISISIAADLYARLPPRQRVRLCAKEVKRLERNSSK